MPSPSPLKTARCLALSLCLLSSSCARTTRPVGEPKPTSTVVASVSSVGWNVLDVDGEVAFLGMLGLGVVSDQSISGTRFDDLVGSPRARARRLSLRLGGEQLVLTRFLEPVGHVVKTPRADDRTFQHVAIVVRDMDMAYARLLSTPMQPVSPAPQTIPASNPVAGGIRAIYFRDPEGHYLELLWFPPDKGDPTWHRAGDTLFLGIDHTAIATTSTTESLRFYRDALGMRVVTESLNEGREQELLSGVPGARVRITSLHGERGPGIELLEYVAPREKGASVSSALPDSVRWETTLEVRSVDAALHALSEAGFAVPASATDARSFSTDAKRAVLVRDPDGHTLRLVEPIVREAPR